MRWTASATGRKGPERGTGVIDHLDARNITLVGARPRPDCPRVGSAEPALAGMFCDRLKVTAGRGKDCWWR